MKKNLILILCIICFSNCKSSKRAKKNNTVTAQHTNIKDHPNVPADYEIIPREEKSSRKKESSKSQADYIIDYALEFEGTRYKWGGTTKSGMDCSGLVFESFRNHDILLPRISRDMAKKGTKISLKKVNTGDLLFFKTGGRRNSINHVGLITAIRNNDIEFIHATSSKGVIVSHLNEKYWLNAFEEARRVL
ncbi:C40 family peptidase [Tamlana sp. 2_MG-2023]|uniref:C40 family peptidase n=1 Tax=unclassified Tamlana TaxID=2614803 RepID=UPI0026E2945A|nr:MULTISPECIES: C40 family peptidase [unclassified Tamlana]MDO6761613.1 C40 family peptidase [Tamlana sp. 2_MG-2023]MDO6792415.1 C40 family peptidase [Tamlana sp. 1_MG-2023]